MANPSQIVVDVATYLVDCPPWDQKIPEELILELAQEISRRFDNTAIYGQIDDLACLLLRERGLGPDKEHPA
jgi:hypothetical protein